MNKFDGDDPTRIWLDDEFHQATGMVMVQLGVNVDEAMARLVEYADVGQWSLELVSSGVVHHTIELSDG